MSDSGMHVVKVKVKLADAAKQGSDLRDAIQKSLNKAAQANPIVIRDFSYRPDKAAVTKFRTTLQQQITAEMKQSPIKLSFKAASITKQDRQAMLSELQADLNKQNLVISVKEINATQAVSNLKSQLTNMLSGLTVGGLKAFLGDDALKNAFSASSNRALNAYADNVEKAFKSITSADLSAQMSGEFRAILDEIERIRHLEADAQKEALGHIEQRIRAYRAEIEVKQKAAATAVTEAKEKKTSDAAARKEADSLGAAQVKVDAFKKRIAAARTELDKVDDVDLKTKLSKQLDDLEKKLEDVTTKAKETRSALLTSLSTDIGDTEKNIKDAVNTPEREQNATEIKALVSEYDNLIKKTREAYQDAGERDAMIAKLREEQAAVQSLQNATTQAQSEALAGMRDKIALSQKEIDAVREQNKAVANQDKTEAAAHRRQTANAQRAVALQKTIQTWISKNTKAYKQYQTQIDQMLITLRREGNLTQQELSDIVLQLTRIQTASKQAGILGQSFLGSIGNIFSKFKGVTITAMIGDKLWDKARDAVVAIKEIDAAMTELRKVTDLTEQSYANFTKTATQMSRDVGSTLADTINATADFARLGYNIDESAALAEAALTYKNVGDGITDISVATESLISTIKAFDVEAMDSMDIVDKYNEVGNNFAISSAGIGEAMRRSAAALASAGNDINESIGLVTGMNTVIQDPDVVGTALKTVSMYLRAAKSEAEAAGIETDGMVDSVSKLRNELLSLTGVDIQLDDDTFKSTYQILKELSEVWEHLSDITRANVLEKIGGKRNGNVVTSLLKNFESAIEAAETAQDSAGSAAAENEKYLDSINGKLQVMQANFEALVSSVVNSDLVKFFLDLGNVALSFANTLQEIHALIPLIIAGFGAKNIWKNSNAANNALGQIINLGASIEDNDIFWESDNYKQAISNIGIEVGKLNKIQQQGVAIKLAAAAAEGKISKELSDQIVKLGILPKAYGTAGKAVTGFGAAALGIVKSAGSILTVIEIIASLYSVYQFINDRIKENRQETIEAGKSVTTDFKEAESKYKDNITKLQSLKEEYDRLSAGVDENGVNVSLTSSEYDRFLELIEEIEKISPSIVDSYDEQTGSVNRYKEAIIEATKAEEGAIEKARLNRMNGSDELVAGAKLEYRDVMDDAQKEAHSVLNAIAHMWGDSDAELFDLEGVLGEQIYKEFTGAYSGISVDELVEILLDKKDQIIANIRNAKDADGNFLFDNEKLISSVEQAFSVLETKYEGIIDKSKEVRDQFVFNMDNGLYGDSDSLKYDQIVTAGLGEEFSKALLGTIDLTMEDGGEEAALAFLSSFASTLTSDKFKNALGWIRDLKNGELTLEDWNNNLAGLTVSEDMAINDAVIDYLREAGDYAIRVANGVEFFNVHVRQLERGPIKTFETAQKGFDLLGKAMEETAASGQVSMETLSQIQEILPEDMDVFDAFVDFSGGKRKLREDEFRQYLRNYVDSEMQQLEQDAADSAKRRDYYSEMATHLRNRTSGLQELLKAEYAYDAVLGDFSAQRRKTTKEELEQAGYKADDFEDGLYLTNVAAGTSDGDNTYDYKFAQNVVFTVNPVDENGKPLNQDELNKYLTEKLEQADGDVEKVIALDQDVESGGRQIIFDYDMVGADESLQSIRDYATERQNLFVEANKVNFADLDDPNLQYSYAEFEGMAEAYGRASKEAANGAKNYAIIMDGVESTSSLLDLSTMWNALEKQAQSASVILDAQKQVADGTALTQAQLMELSREHPEYNWFATADDVNKQAELLGQAAKTERSAFEQILLARRKSLALQRNALQENDEVGRAAYQSQIDNINAVLKLADQSDVSLMDILFPAEKTNTAEEQIEKIQDVIDGVQKYKELIQTVKDEIAKGGNLSAETMLDMQSMFGQNWQGLLSWDPSGERATGVHIDTVNTIVERFIETELQGIDTTGKFGEAIKAAFAEDPGELKASDRLKDYMSLIGDVYDLTGQIDKEALSGNGNSLSTLENLVSLMGEDYGNALDIVDGKLKINTQAVINWQTKQLAMYSDMDEAERAAIQGAYEQAAAMENLKDAISGVDKASSLIDTIQEEIFESGYNTFDTLSSFIEMIGEGWEEHVNFAGTGFTLSTDAIYQQMAKSIDAVITPGTELNTVLKAQLDTALKVEQANKSLTDSYAGLETAVSGYTNIGSSIELTHDMISQLIEVDSRYAQAIEYQNGRLQLNKAKYDEVTKSVEQNVKAQAEAAAQAILTGKEYQDLIKKMQTEDLDASEQNRLDSLNAQVMAFKVMESAVDSSTSALQRFLNATDQVNAVTYEGAKSAYQTIEDVLYNKDSDMYGMIGHEKFEEAMKLMISPDVEIDTKEFNKQFKILARYFEDSRKGMDTLYKDMLKKGIIDKATGQIDTTVGEAAKLLGITEEAFRFAVDQYNQYQREEHKINIGGKTNEELQEQTGIGKLIEDVETVQKAAEDLEKDGINIPADQALENVAMLNLGLDDTIEKVGIINNTPMVFGPSKIDSNTEWILPDTKEMSEYLQSLREEAKIKVDARGAIRALDHVAEGAAESKEELGGVSSAVYGIDVGLESIGQGDLDIDTSNIFKDLLEVLSKLGDIAKKLDAIDGMDVDANVNVTQTATTKTSSSSVSSSSTGRFVDYLGIASASGTSASAGGKTLVGELGPEMVVDPSQNKWYTVGARGPEFVNLPKNAIVFDANQTSALFNKGRTSKRGEAMAAGTSSLVNALLNPSYESVKKNNLENALKEVIKEVQGPKQQSSSSNEKVTSNQQKENKRLSSSSKSSGGSSSSSKEKKEEQTVLEKLQEQYQKLIDQHEHLIEHQEFLFRNAERGMDFAGMESSLENQVQIYKDMMADVQKGISEMVANGASDTDKELQSLEEAYWSAHDSMYEALNEINKLYVDGLTEKIDGIQSAYSNLANAADELANNGTISVDTFQSLIDNGVQYMSLLEKVNGQYVINEEGINKLVAAEKKRLAVESALSYLGQVQQALNDKDTHLLQNLTDLSNRIGQSSWDAVYAQAALLKNMGLTGDQYDVVIENINALKAVSESVSGDITSDAKKASDTVGKGLKEQQDALDEILQLTQDLIEHETNERIEAIEEEIDQYKEIIRLKKESLETTKEENDYMESVSEKTAELAKLQARIDQLSLDDSRSAAAERATLEAELSELQKELSDLQSDHAYDAQTEALDKQAEAYEQERQKEIDDLEASIGSAEKLYQTSIERLNGGWGSLYDQLIAWNTEVGSSLNSEITEGWEKAAEAVRLYGSYSSAVKQLDAKIEAGEDKHIAVSKSDLPIFHDGGVVGGGGIGDEIMAVVQKGEVIINEAGQQVLYKIIDFQRYLSEKLGTAFGGFDFSSGTMRNAVAALPASAGAFSAATDTSSPFVFSPSIHVEIAGGADMNARNAKQFGEKIATTAIDQLREAFGRKGVTANMSTRLRQS